MNLNKHQQMVSKLLEETEKKYGAARTEKYKNDFKQATFESMSREIVCQIISCQAWWRRIIFLAFFPGYIGPYIFRIRRRKAT